jgi:hypothetical protein
MKGKALRRALETDAIRVGADLPMIQDSTELITPESAKEFLKRNQYNRPINWRAVEEYAGAMKRGGWKLHAQGVVLDTEGNILTGQKRLWAVIYANTNVYMRVSRGNPVDTARLLDRGTPQSSRDLAARETNRRHSPIEASIARCVCVLNGTLKPSVDQLALAIADCDATSTMVLSETKGTKKTRAILMILGAIVEVSCSTEDAKRLAKQAEWFASRLDTALKPATAEQCWNRGAAFGLALESARRIVEEAR